MERLDQPCPLREDSRVERRPDVIPQLSVKGGIAAVEFYKEAFEAVEI